MCSASPSRGDPTPVAGVPNLWAAQVDTRGRFEQSWSHIRGYLVGVLAARGMAEVQAEELTVLPGAEEIVALLELRRLAESGDFDAIVVDCAPDRRDAAAAGAAGDHRLLRPAAARRPAAGAAQHRRVADRPARRRPNATVRDALGELLSELMAARALLADPAITGVRLVLTPERMVVAEARRLFTALSLHGFGVEAVTVNRLLPQRRRRRVPAPAAGGPAGGDDPGRGVVPGPADPPGPAEARRNRSGSQRSSEMATTMFGAIDPLASRSARPRSAIEVSGSDGLVPAGAAVAAGGAGGASRCPGRAPTWW